MHSHIFFANDSLVFGKAEVSHTIELKHLLTKYEDATDHMVNIEKSSIFFSRNI